MTSNTSTQVNSSDPAVAIQVQRENAALQRSATLAAAPSVTGSSTTTTTTASRVGRSIAPVVSGSEVLYPQSTTTTSSNAVTINSSVNNDVGDVTTVYSTGGAITVNPINQTINQYTSVDSGVSQVVAGNGVTITSTGGSGTGIVTISSTGGGNSEYGNSNVANYLPTYTGNVGAGNVNVTGTVYANGLSSTGLASLTTLNVSATANLGAVGNVKITGGSAGQKLTTDGAGNLTWTNDANSSYGNSNVVSLLSAFGSNTITTTGNVSVGNIVGNSTINIDNRDSGNAADIQLFAADDIVLQARDRTLGSASEGGDINIFAGDSAEDGDSSGGDVVIEAGAGGAANVDFGGSGGFITIQSGRGGAAIGNSGYSAENGGDLTLSAGDAGDNNGNIDLGSAGGAVFIESGFSTGNTDYGGEIVLTTGTGGQNAASGNVRIVIPGYGNTTGGTWIFDGNGNLTLPGNLIVPTGNIESATLSPAFTSTITGINTGSPTVLVTLAGPVFDGPFSGTVTISSVTGTTEANGVWGYQGIDPSTFQLYTDATLTTPVDGMTWTTYVSGGNAVGDATYTDFTIQGGNVSIGGNDNTWEFGDDGNLTLPGNTFAVNYANGTQVSIGGGGANTGNVTFDDNIVIGTGDEFGSAGLFLAPGNGSIANGAVQYLRVRGGDAPTHIHLDTGNNQFYDQYFGDDAKYVKLELGDAGNVVVGTDDATGNNYNWTFTSDGNLILANGNSVIQSIANSSLDPLNPNVSTIVLTPDPGYSSQSLVLDPTAPGHIHLRAVSPSDIDAPAANIFLGGEDTSFEITQGINNQAVIHSGGYDWTFGNDGNLTLPGNIVTPNGANAVVPSTVGTAGAPLIISAGTGGDAATSLNAGNGGNLTITAGDAGSNIGNQSWGEVGGDLALRGGNATGPYVGGNVAIYSGAGPTAPGAISLYTGANQWTFDATGNLTVPGSLINDTSMVLSAPSIFNICTIVTAGSGYNTGSSLKATTGGSGTGMTVGIGYGLSNQLTSVNVVDPGTGYVNGDVITVSEGTGGTFVLTKYNQSANQTNNNTIQTDFTFANSTVTLPIYGEMATDASMTLTTNLANAGNTYSWTFGDDGRLTFPGTPRIDTADDNFEVQAAEAINFEANTVVNIYTDSGNNAYQWQFGDDGTLTVPFEGVIQSFDDTIVLQSVDTGTGNANSVRLATDGSLYFEGTEYLNGWFQIANDSGDANIVSPSGNISITPAFGVANAAGKSLTLQGGDADQSDFYTGTGGAVNITGGLGSSDDGGGGGPGGNVNITSGLSADPAGVAGNINITSGSKDWVFDYTGNLSFPTNGQLVMDNGDGTIGNQGDDFVISWNNEDLVLRSVAGDVNVESDNDFNVQVNYDGNTTDYLTKWIFSSNNEIINITGNSAIITEAGNLNLQGGRDTLSNGNVQITAVNTGVAVNTWTFGNDGNLIIPGTSGGFIKTVSNASIGIAAMDNGTNNPAQLLSINVGNGNATSIISAYASNATIQTNASGNINTWAFNNAGNLTLPTGGHIIVSGGLVSSGASPAPTINGFSITNSVGISGNGNIAGNNISATGTLTATGKIGYASGSTVTQTTSRGNGVTINAIAGTIITTSAAMVATEIDTFAVTNNSVDPNNDIVIAQIVSPNQGTYDCIANPALIGGFNNGFFINIVNISGFTTSNEAITIRFMVLKAPNA